MHAHEVRWWLQEVPARSLQVLQHHVFLWLSNAMHVCPHSVYVNMGLFMANNPEYHSILGLPANLVLRQGKLKLSIVEGLEDSSWTRSEKAAVAQLLLKMDNAVLFSHLGSCQKVRCASRSTRRVLILHPNRKVEGKTPKTHNTTRSEHAWAIALKCWCRHLENIWNNSELLCVLGRNCPSMAQSVCCHLLGPPASIDCERGHAECCHRSDRGDTVSRCAT